MRRDALSTPRVVARKAMPGSRRFVLLCITGLFAWLFADALFGDGMFVFRDAAHFYYPLFQFTADQWAAGRVPLWNPYENLGMPLAGNPAAGVFYPGKLIFALPISYPWAYKIYIMGHLLLAAYAAYRLARHWQASVEAAGLCAISYAFSGNVLFTYCNVVFLVGAAWLPAAMLAADRMLGEGPEERDEGRGEKGEGRRRAWWAVVFGVVLALMVLGGDPQMAYNAGLLAAIYALWLWRYDRSFAPSPSPLTPRPSPLASRPALLALAASVGLALSAIQVWPSVEFTRHSGRVVGSTADRLLCRIEPGTHGEHTYQFSVGPWRLAEYLWPNASGRQFPVPRRWLGVIPAEGRIWTPSLYMGLLPLLLALSAMRLRRRRPQGSPPRRSEPRDRWLSWSVVLAVLASFGWYAPGWLVGEIHLAAGGNPGGPGPVASPLGGLYWLATVVLPGYAYFRYPAKLLVVAALGLSVLAARGFDHQFAEPSARFRRGLLWLGGASLCGAVAALVVRPFWHTWLAGVQADMLFGPLDTAGAAGDLLAAFLQTALLCTLFWWLLGRAGSGGRWVPAVALVTVAVDLAVANGWMVACAPVGQWQEPSKLATILRQAEAPTGGQPYRVLRGPIWTPPRWKSESSPDRLAEAMRWDVDTLWPKYNLAERIPLAEVYGAMMPHDYETFLSVAKERPSPHARRIPFSLAKYVILPGRSVLPAASPIDTGVEDASLWSNPDCLPRAWIVHNLDVLPPLDATDRAQLRQRTEDVLYPAGRPRDLRREAVVETDLKLPAAKGRPKNNLATVPILPQGKWDYPPPKPPPAAPESCRVVWCDPLQVVIEAELARPGLVVLCDQFYPGWKLEVATAGHAPKPTPILRTNRVMRGAWLPAGRHRLTYRYRPASFTRAAIISLLAWLGVALGLALGLRDRRISKLRTRKEDTRTFCARVAPRDSNP